MMARLREGILNTLLFVGGLTQLAWQTVQQTVRRPFPVRLTMVQFDQIGFMSLSIVAISSVFIGMVLALQSTYSLGEFGASVFVGPMVALSLVRELAPVLMALMVGGRVGAGMTAEIGTMKVTEQIDAMRALATNPVKKLVVPKVVATTVMLPALTIVSCGLGMVGGMIIAVLVVNMTPNYYWRSIITALNFRDFVSGIGKTFFFGFTIALIACFNGFRASGGADGVGRATTTTVVMASISVLIMDFFLTKIFFLIT